MISATTPVVDLESRLMELDVVCGECEGTGIYTGTPDFDSGIATVGTMSPCDDCKGSGKQYPLRIQCPCDYEDWDRHECFPLLSCWKAFRKGFIHKRNG